VIAFRCQQDSSDFLEVADEFDEDGELEIAISRDSSVYLNETQTQQLIDDLTATLKRKKK